MKYKEIVKAVKAVKGGKKLWKEVYNQNFGPNNWDDFSAACYIATKAVCPELDASGANANTWNAVASRLDR